MRLIGGAPALTALLILAGAPAMPGAQVLREHPIKVTDAGEAVLTITARCNGCDWRIRGREAAVLKLTVNGIYSQHLVLSRGERPVAYSVLLGHLQPGAHVLVIERDRERSAVSAGDVTIAGVSVRMYSDGMPEHTWLAHAPFVYARPGSVERFSDIPLFMYVEEVAPASRRYAYTVIFSHEDGGTPTDRLMATWGRSTDIEYIYGVTVSENEEGHHEEFQGADHAILPFKGTRVGSHPLLWVSTVNNMVSDTGPADAVRFAPAPQFVHLADTSREKVMDDNPWLYSLMTAELYREGRIDPNAAAGSGKVADPRRFGVIEACGAVRDATLAFDLGVEAPNGATVWHASEGGDARFRIMRGGCFRSAVPLPENTSVTAIKAVRVRAYTRPPRNGEAPLPAGTGEVELQRLNSVFMLDADFEPVRSDLTWTGSLQLRGESPPQVIPHR